MFTRARKMFYRARGHYSGRLGDEPFLLDPYHSKFWRKASAGAWEPETLALLDAHLDRDHDYLDIGAWIGPTVLFGARKARHVWCFEPDPEAFRALAWNIELNGLENVSAFAAALSQGVGIARMAGMRGERGDSTTSLLNPDGSAGSDVLTIGFDDVARSVDLSGVSLVKIDVEGAEFDLLPTMTDWLKHQKPALLLSTHGPFLDSEFRAEKLDALAESLSFYPRCTDDTGRTMTRADFSGTDAQTRFRSYVFSA